MKITQKNTDIATPTYLKPTKSFAVIGLSTALVCSAPAALVITNGDFEGVQVYSISATGNGVTNTDYSTNGDGWYYSEWSNPANGGPLGTGDAYGAHAGAKIRGALNILTDNKTTTGSVTLSIDMLASTASIPSKFYKIKVWGINDSNAGSSGIQWDGQFDLSGPGGNPDGLDLRNPSQGTSAAVSYTGSNITQLLSTTVTLSGTSWQLGNQFTFNLGSTGYDQLAVGFVIDSTGSAIGVDNLVVVPEPSSLVLFGLGFGALLTRRRR